jgi:hypothetical protein
VGFYFVYQRSKQSNGDEGPGQAGVAYTVVEDQEGLRCCAAVLSSRHCYSTLYCPVVVCVERMYRTGLVYPDCVGWYYINTLIALGVCVP